MIKISCDAHDDGHKAEVLAGDGFAQGIFTQFGITVDDDGGAPSTVSEADRIQLVDLWQENTEVLRLGCQEKFDHALHLNGSGGAVKWWAWMACCLL